MKKLLCLLLSTAFLLGSFAGCSSKKSGSTSGNDTNESPTSSDDNPTGPASNPNPSTPKPSEPEKPGKAPASVTVGDVRVQLLTDSLVRIEMKGKKGFEDRASFNVIKRTDWDDVAYTTSETDAETLITTEKYVVHVPKNASKNPTGAYITDPKGNELWTYVGNTDSNVFLPSPSDELKSWYFADSPRVIPSENGYSPSETGAANNGWDLSNDATDLFVFLPGGSYENFAYDYITLTGPSEMVTLNMLGYWDSRYYEYNSKTALQQIKDYQDRGYSIDVLVIDTDWRQSSSVGGVGYDINKRLFPDMAKFLEQAHEMGVTIMFNDHPEPAKGTNKLLDKNEVEYRNKNLKLILSLGVDIWWYDRNWSVALNEIKDGISIYASGMYAYQWITEDYYNSIADINEYARRALIMGNVDGIWNGELTYAPEISAHKYSIQWTGDIGTDSPFLADEIYNMIYGGAVLGLPYMSSDIGGHNYPVTTNDMYVRWMQYGALSPICRVHCMKPYSRMPWLYGDTAEAVTHQYVDMRYRLLPLYYQLSHENYVTGLPLIRRLDLLYPQYVEASRNDEYLLGDYILVAPLSDSYATATDFSFVADDGKDGLLGEYFTNKELSGTPKFTQYDKEVNFDWQTGSPTGLGVNDNFSIRWTGKVKIGASDIALRFFADDGIRVWIDGEQIADGWTVYDTYFISDVLKAGSTHSIKIEYCEIGDKAHIYVTGVNNDGVSRDVFLPEGEWMDVWTGKTYAGPVTITVTHPLETSPIFVRMGAIIPLADNMTNTSEKNWSHLTLDVYPSISKEASAQIYEDDTKTVGYKDGQFRTTDLTLKPTSDKAMELVVGAAKGSFSGDLAFTSRDYTVRIHGREGYGELTSVTLNGTALEIKKYAKDPNADPLANQGSARDGIIYEVTFKADVDKESKLVLTFASAVADGENKDYNANPAEFDVKINELKKADADVNLTAYGNKDWLFFGPIDAYSVIRKNVKNHLIGDVESHWNLTAFYDNYNISWNDGDSHASGSSTRGPVSKLNFDTVLKVTPDQTHYQIYLGGYKSLAKITIRDRAGNVRTLTFGDMNTNYYRMIEIDCKSAAETELHISYSLLCGDNITFSAVTASDGKVEDVKPPVSSGFESGLAAVTSYTGTLDLTAEGTVDWEFYGKVNESDSHELTRKAGVTDRINTTFNGTVNLHWDNKALVTWSDGDPAKSASTRNGKNAMSSITVKVDIKDCSTLTLLVGAWKSTCTMAVFDADGNALENESLITAGDNASMALVTLDLSKYDTDALTVEITCINSNGGNNSLTGVALK